MASQVGCVGSIGMRVSDVRKGERCHAWYKPMWVKLGVHVCVCVYMCLQACGCVHAWRDSRKDEHEVLLVVVVGQESTWPFLSLVNVYILLDVFILHMEHLHNGRKITPSWSWGQKSYPFRLNSTNIGHVMNFLLLLPSLASWSPCPPSRPAVQRLLTPFAMSQLVLCLPLLLLKILLITLGPTR